MILGRGLGAVFPCAAVSKRKTANECVAGRKSPGHLTWEAQSPGEWSTMPLEASSVSFPALTLIFPFLLVLAFVGDTTKNSR